jgi:hypothetical protein
MHPTVALLALRHLAPMLADPALAGRERAAVDRAVCDLLALLRTIGRPLPRA